MHSRGAKNWRLVLSFSLSFFRSLVHARVMKLFLHRAPVSCTHTYVHTYKHTCIRAPRRFYCSGPRHTARGIRASKAWRSEKCWKLDIQSVQGTAIPVEILLSSRVAPLCIRSRVARLDKSTDKTIIRNRSFYHRRSQRRPELFYGHRSIVAGYNARFDQRSLRFVKPLLRESCLRLALPFVRIPLERSSKREFVGGDVGDGRNSRESEDPTSPLLRSIL